MRTAIPLSILLVAGCAGSPAARHAATPRPVVAATKAAASPSTTPTASMPQPTPTPDGRLAGTLRIDARFAIDLGAAELVGQTVRIVANNGGSIIANNGGSIVANNGGSIISEHGGGFGLLQTTAPPALGTILPVAGMRVMANGMADAKLLATGATDERGEFRLAVPDDYQGNVVVAAALPSELDKRLNSPRGLEYEHVTFLTKAERQEPAHNAIDEDTAVVYRYLREDFGQRLDDMLVRPDPQPLYDQIDRSLPGGGAILKTPLETMRAKARELGYVNLPVAQRLEGAARIAALALGDVDLATVKTNVGGSGWDGPPDDPALPILIDMMRRIREGATTKLAADPHFFDNKPYLAPGTRIPKPASLCDYIVTVTFAGSDPAAVGKLDPFLKDLEVPGAGPLRAHFTAAMNGMILTLGLNLVNKQDAILAELEAVTRR